MWVVCLTHYGISESVSEIACKCRLEGYRFQMANKRECIYSSLLNCMYMTVVRDVRKISID